MPKFQSSVQDLTAIFRGSAQLQVAPYNAAEVAAMAASTDATDAVSWVDVGSIDGLVFSEAITSTQLKGDNALEVKYVSDQTISLEFNQREAIREAVRAVVRGTFDVSGTPVPASIVNNHSYVVSSGGWNYNKFIPFDHQNGDKSKITPDSVTGGVNGALDIDVDFVIVEQESGSGIWGIVLMDSAAGKLTTEAQSVTIVYDYTPYASQTTYFGGKTTMPYFMARLSNVNESSNLVRFWAWKLSLNTGMEFAFKKDDDADPTVTQAIKATAILDTSVATAGKQLGKLYQVGGI
jgi:hypothetical protein